MNKRHFYKCIFALGQIEDEWIDLYCSFHDDKVKETDNKIEIPVVEQTVDDGVVHGGAHGEPHDAQVHLLDKAFLEQVGVELV